MGDIDIFCQVIDNFGDAGVCLRLARQLQDNGHTVRIYTDNTDIFYQLSIQQNISVHEWNQAQTAPLNGMVIEAFACELPENYKKTIKNQNSLWLNLEYLSAESWVETYHKLPSPQPDGSNKYFFFPGFSTKTGGLLRNNQEIKKYRQSARITEISRISQASPKQKAILDNADLIVFLFCYPNAPLAGLQHALAQLDKNTCVLLAGGPRPIKSQNKLHIIELPLVKQIEFDSLLWLSDINFIRGEDSLAQSSWPGKPVVWQAYVQTEDTHLEKLSAWLETAKFPEQVNDLILAWNRGDNAIVSESLLGILNTDTWHKWQAASRNFSNYLYQQIDLVSNLENFYKEKLGNS